MMILNPNKNVVAAIKRRLMVTEGQCPCVPQDKWNEDTMCECKEKREQDICHCTLFVKAD